MDKLDWRSVKPNEDGRFNCFDCNGTFSTRSNAKIHYKTVHMKENKFYCKVCEEYFTSANDLNQHLKASHKIRGRYFGERAKFVLIIFGVLLNRSSEYCQELIPEL